MPLASGPPPRDQKQRKKRRLSQEESTVPPVATKPSVLLSSLHLCGSHILHNMAADPRFEPSGLVLPGGTAICNVKARSATLYRGRAASYRQSSALSHLPSICPDLTVAGSFTHRGGISIKPSSVRPWECAITNKLYPSLSARAGSGQSELCPLRGQGILGRNNSGAIQYPLCQSVEAKILARCGIHHHLE